MMNLITCLKKALLISFLISPHLCVPQNNQILKLKTDVNNYFTKSKVDPNKHVISFSGSSNYFPLQFSGFSSSIIKQNFLHHFPYKRGHFLADALYLNYQYTLKNNFLIEGGFKYMTVWSSFVINLASLESSNFSIFGESKYALYSFDLGTGYKIIINNNLRLFDVHMGVNLSIADNKKGASYFKSFSIGYTDKMGVQKNMYLSETTVIEKKVGIGTYIGLSKDIRITENLYLTARYHSYFGRKSTISRHIFKYQLPDLGIANETRAIITTKGKMYTLGLKWIF